jgi:GT2 family glycosyltransferase
VKTSVIIPVHNGADYLPDCLTALFAQQDIDFEVIVVDNGSNDNGAQIVAEQFPQARLLQSATALGFSGAVNRGLRLALSGDSELLVLLNQDTRVQPGWLAELLAPFTDDPQIGISGAKALFPDGRIQHAGGQLLLPLGYGRNRGYGSEADADLSDEPIDFLSGVSLALRRSMLDQIGLFDEGFNPAYYEDVDLCLRARAAGWSMRYVATAVLIHAEGAARVGGDYDHAALIERNRLRLLLKHRSTTELLQEFVPAEQTQLAERSEGGGVQVLRKAYLAALLMLPELRPGPDNAPLRSALRDLRRQAIGFERTATRGPQSASRGRMLPGSPEPLRTQRPAVPALPATRRRSQSSCSPGTASTTPASAWRASGPAPRASSTR